uniref:Uncharacterized protein n=1 Tax=Cyclophora tenuis TaxID=216820 RepID=A0A7S1D3K4_CYCTE|mmetsp:Transcript_18770/g.32084  ORF Transcript_18770/g.32084 Transcript_18770/m.32084 type:complete len:100 (+) Transcript_18770:103-402(+)
MLNNALRQTARTVGVRHQSSSVSTTFLKGRKALYSRETFKANWLSDTATYPLLAVMGAATLLVVGVGASCLSFSPDVRIYPSKRSSIVRTWGLPGYKHD